MIIQRVSGLSWQEYLTKNIFEPAGMKHTGFHHDVPVPKLTTGYTRGKNHPNGKRRENHTIINPYARPAGGMYSTTGDLLKFIKALQNAELFDKSIFTEATTAKVDWVLPYPHRISYGYGFSVEKLWGVKFYGHSGSQPGVAARLRVYPELNMTVIILSNYDNATRNAMHYIFDLTADYQED